MKTILLSALLCAAFFTQISAQTYQPFPTQNAVWRGSYGNGNEENFLEQNIAGDTLIGGKTYHKVYQKGYVVRYFNNTTGDFYANRLVLFFREENKRIYAIDARISDSDEYLIYDFNLQVGDTLPQNILTRNVPFLVDHHGVIAKIDSVQTLDGIFRKRFSFVTDLESNLQNRYIIEGVGSRHSLMGLLPQNNSEIDFGGRICLFQKDGIDIYRFGLASSCQLISSASDPRPEILSISPNPMSDVSSIRVENWEQLLGGRLEVSDVAGRLLFQKTIQSESDFRLQRSDFQAGMLLVSVKSRQGVLRYVGKLIAE